MRDPDRPGSARCRCCQLVQPICLDAHGVTARVCAKCTHHQGEQDTKRLARAESHERMLRQWLDACRASESQAKAEIAQARDAVAAALRSRSGLAARLVDAADRSGTHRCPMQELANDRQVIRWARREDEDDVRYHRSVGVTSCQP
jgi:hypothetical protein